MATNGARGPARRGWAGPLAFSAAAMSQLGPISPWYPAEANAAAALRHVWFLEQSERPVLALQSRSSAPPRFGLMADLRDGRQVWKPDVS